MVEKAKNNRFISVIIVLFALITGAKGVAESIEYFAQKASGAKEQVVEKSTSLPANKPDSLKTTPDSSLIKASSKDAIGGEQANELSKIHMALSKLFMKIDYRVEMDKTGLVGLIDKEDTGRYVTFNIQDVRFEWRTDDFRLHIVSDKKKINVRELYESKYSDGTPYFYYNKFETEECYFSFSKSDSEKIKQLFERYRKYVKQGKK